MMAHAPGIGWRDGLRRMSPHARYDIFRQLGEATAALHSLRYPQFGEVEDGRTSPPAPLLAGWSPSPSPSRGGWPKAGRGPPASHNMKRKGESPDDAGRYRGEAEDRPALA